MCDRQTDTHFQSTKVVHMYSVMFLVYLSSYLHSHVEN